MFISHLSSFIYIEADGETLEIPFQALEIIAIIRRIEVPKEKSTSPWENLSELIKGRDALGWGKLLDISDKKNWFGLGYKPANIGSQKNDQRKFHTLQDVFHNAGYMDEDHVVVIEEENEGIPDMVCRCSLDTTQ